MVVRKASLCPPAPDSEPVAKYLLASKHSDILALEQLLSMGQLLITLSDLVHVLQLERGASNMYLGSGGQRCADFRERQVLAAQRAEQQFRTNLDAATGIHGGGLPSHSRLFSRVAYALHGLDELNAVRRDIAQRQIAPETIIDGYSELIQSLLAIVYETADSAADPEISRVLVAMFHLMQGKELAGQERAVGSAGFAQGRFGEQFSRRLHRLIESQERCFQTFVSFAEGEALTRWQALQTSASNLVLERLRRIAFASATEGHADCGLSDTWFSVTSERIDVLKAIEQQLETALSELCQHKIALARLELDNHRLQINAHQQTNSAPAFAIFFSHQPTGVSPHSDSLERFDTGCAGPQLGRSLFDLVQAQAERLQAMSEELAAARTALSERKTIEKAKGLIMQSRRVGEEEAYRFLRQAAMAQNRKLAEVARDALTLAELLNPPSQP